MVLTYHGKLMRLCRLLQRSGVSKLFWSQAYHVGHGTAWRKERHWALFLRVWHEATPTPCISSFSYPMPIRSTGALISFLGMGCSSLFVCKVSGTVWPWFQLSLYAVLQYRYCNNNSSCDCKSFFFFFIWVRPASGKANLVQGFTDWCLGIWAWYIHTFIYM